MGQAERRLAEKYRFGRERTTFAFHANHRCRFDGDLNRSPCEAASGPADDLVRRPVRRTPSCFGLQVALGNRVVRAWRWISCDSKDRPAIRTSASHQLIASRLATVYKDALTLSATFDLRRQNRIEQPASASSNADASRDRRATTWTPRGEEIATIVCVQASVGVRIRRARIELKTRDHRWGGVHGRLHQSADALVINR